MPRQYESYMLAGSDGSDFNDAQQQLTTGAGNSEQTLALEKDCVALFLSARAANAYVTFNGTTASASNGIEILAGAQPVFIPLGYHAAGAPTVLHYIGSGANCLLNVLQLG